LQKRGHFYFALTEVLTQMLCRISKIMRLISEIMRLESQI
jgi:hypothetical protein